MYLYTWRIKQNIASLKIVCFDSLIQYLAKHVQKVSVSSIMTQYLDNWSKYEIFIFIYILHVTLFVQNVFIMNKMFNFKRKESEFCSVNVRSELFFCQSTYFASIEIQKIAKWRQYFDTFRPSLIFTGLYNAIT